MHRSKRWVYDSGLHAPLIIRYEGASIAFRTDPESRWSLYTAPFRVSGKISLYVRAIRIGYTESEELVVHL